MTTPPENKITGPSFFIGMNGDGLISFGSGQPDLPPPKAIFEHLAAQRLFQYGPIQGDEQLRQALAGEYPNASPADFVITNGASEALDLMFRALYQLHGPSKVLICRPYYYSYPPIVSLAGHTPVYTDLHHGKIDLEDFTAKLRGVKAVIINSPSNPTGRVEELATVHAIEKITAELGIYLISDEVYKDLIYERENYHIQGANVITINSFSKTYSMCGLRVGYLYTPDAQITQEVIAIKTHTSMNTNSLGQEMALKAMQVPHSFIERQGKVWMERRNAIYEGLLGLGFDVWKPEGAFYVLPKIKHSDRVVAELFHQHKVVVYDGAWFGAPGRIRLSYALELSKITEGLARIGQYLKGKEDWLA